MSRRNSNLDGEDGVDDEASCHNEQHESAGNTTPFATATANAIQLLNLANTATAQQPTNTSTSGQTDVLQQLQTFIQQAASHPIPQQQSQAPTLASFAPTVTNTMPFMTHQQQQQQQQQPVQDAIPMLMNALLIAHSPSRTLPHAELNQTLLLALTQLVQYRNLAQFLMQQLSQTMGHLPSQMLLATLGGFPPSLVPPTTTMLPTPPTAHVDPQQQQSGVALLAALGHHLAQNLSTQGTGGMFTENNRQNVNAPMAVPIDQLPMVLSQFQMFLQQLANEGGGGSSNTVSLSNHNDQSGFQPLTTQYPTMAAFAGNNVSEVTSTDMDQQLNTMGANASRPGAAATASSGTAAAQEPPIPMPVRKKRKYDHESFPEKLHRLIIDAEAHGNESIVRFTQDGSKFQILNSEAFEERILPQYFRHNRMSSFKRLLRMYQYSRVQGTWMEGTFEHPLFHRDYPDWCKRMQRQE